MSKRLTDRQFVIMHYPNAELSYRVIPHETIAPSIYYNILAEHLHNGTIIGRGDTASLAWRSAKKRILNPTPTP